MFRLAHLSDPHLPMPHARLPQLFSKRATGYLNWWRNRVRVHVPEALAGIVTDIDAQQPDHVALTGDLVNVSLPQEFERAAEWLATLGPPEHVTLVPGNHDFYVPVDWTANLGRWGAYMAGDGVPAPRGPGDFPTLRRRDGVALIGLSTAVPTLPLMATGRLGEAQIARAGDLLKKLRREGLFRIVMIHHPPVGASRFKRLTDAAAFAAMIREAGGELILHGHNHRSEVAQLQGPAGPIPVLGVTSASAAGDSPYGRARYHLIEIDRQDGGWRLRVELRALSADGAGCEPDGELSFHISAANAAIG